MRKGYIMIKITLGILCLTSFVFADKIAFTSAACPETETFKKLNVKTKNALEANQILVNNNCEVLEVSDKINVVNQMEGDYFEIFIEKLGKRKANMTNMVPMGSGYTRLEFEIPARGLIGIRTEFLTETKGEGVMNHSFLDFRPHSGTVESRKYGALVSMEAGECVGYSIFSLQDRGIMYIKPQDKVYNGMVIGQHAKSNDLDVNPTKAKQQSNVRSSGADEAIKLVPPRVMSLENALEWIEEDELVEVTPISVRVRKRELDATIRKRTAKKVKFAD